MQKECVSVHFGLRLFNNLAYLENFMKTPMRWHIWTARLDLKIKIHLKKKALKPRFYSLWVGALQFCWNLWYSKFQVCITNSLVLILSNEILKIQHTHTNLLSGMKVFYLQSIKEFYRWLCWLRSLNIRVAKIVPSAILLLKSIQVMVRLHIFPIFSFLAKMLSFL